MRTVEKILVAAAIFAFFAGIIMAVEQESPKFFGYGCAVALLIALMAMLFSVEPVSNPGTQNRRPTDWDKL